MLKSSKVLGRFVSWTLQSGKPVCLCCRKPIWREPNWLQKLVIRVIGDTSLIPDWCDCWKDFRPYDFRIDWFDS